jgi:hypothetical protein
VLLRLVLVLAVSALGSAQRMGSSRSTQTDPTVSRFAVAGAPAIQALLELSRTAHVPLGIIVDDEALCKSQVSYSAENTPASWVAKRIAASVPGYSLELSADSKVMVIGPVSRRSSTEQFLSLTDDRYAVKGNLQTLATMLWVHIRAILHPDQGTAGSILGSPNDAIFTLEVREARVEQILNQIVLLTKGAWVLRPLPPTLANLNTDPLFLVSESGVSTSNSADLCTPVAEADHK